MTDPLTDLHDRRAFPTAYARTARALFAPGEGIVLLRFDITRVKRVNRLSGTGTCGATGCDFAAGYRRAAHLVDWCRRVEETIARTKKA